MHTHIWINTCKFRHKMKLKYLHVMHLTFVCSKERALGTACLVSMPMMSSGLKQHIRDDKQVSFLTQHLQQAIIDAFSLRVPILYFWCHYLLLHPLLIASCSNIHLGLSPHAELSMGASDRSPKLPTSSD